MKRKAVSEAPNFASDADDLGSHGVNGGVNELVQLQQEAAEEPLLEDSEEGGGEEEQQGEEYEEDDDDEYQEEQGVEGVPQHEDGVVLGQEFFEVEAIRRKRIHKGQVQYYIKWKEWPEKANTWEPPENLESVPDVVAAFEESLKSGKHRKRKRKTAVHHALLKKRLERSATPYSLRQFPTTTANNHTQPAPSNDIDNSNIPAFPQTVLFADEVEDNGDASSFGKSKLANDNKSANASDQTIKRNEEYDYDPKLSELKATMTADGYDADKIGVQIEEVKLPTGNNHHMDGESMGVCVEPVQNDRCRGAKRRKSNCVKRFTKDSDAGESVNPQRSFGASVVADALVPMGTVDAVVSNGHMNTEHARLSNNIVQIIKPVGYLAGVPNNAQDVLVTFMALRSDGTEVMVDNKYLKSNNPLLLINFYERHLRYTPSEQSIERGS